MLYIMLSVVTLSGIMLGEGKTTYTFSISVNVLSANIPFSVVPAGGGGWVRRKRNGNSLALAENVYVILPRPHYAECLGATNWYKVETISSTDAELSFSCGQQL